tara:strand:- start:74 stop:283 length:210 start_codon:yes stop_codon:yes gene_type:complete
LIHSIFARIAGYFLIFGFIVFVIGPSWSWVKGDGFVVDENYWVELVAVSIFVVWTEISRFRRVNRTRFK